MHTTDLNLINLMVTRCTPTYSDHWRTASLHNHSSWPHQLPHEDWPFPCSSDVQCSGPQPLILLHSIPSMGHHRLGSVASYSGHNRGCDMRDSRPEEKLCDTLKSNISFWPEVRRCPSCRILSWQVAYWGFYWEST